MAKDNVKIPAKHYVGMSPRREDGLPLGFMTPWGEDAAAAKRMQTVDSWAGRSGLPAVVIDNVPMCGFKLTKSIRTTNYGGHDHWRVEDPRGFELEISSGNLAQLLSVGTVEHGEFLDECVWARHGANNVLLSTATNEYKEAVENTRVAGIKTNWKDVKLGNRIVLQNNIKGVWLGKMHVVTLGYSSDGSSAISENYISTSSKSLHLILSDEKISNYVGTLYMLANPKLSYVEDATSIITSGEAEQHANRLLNDKNIFTSVSGYRTPLLATFDTIYCGKNLELALDHFPESDESELKRIMEGYDNHKLIGRQSNGKIGLLAKYSNDIYPRVAHISEPHLALGELRNVQVPNQDRPSYWSSRTQPFVQSKDTCAIADFVDIYRLKMIVRTKAGNEISAFLR